ncbi:MAG: glycosyltransferase family protein [Synergistaceae bacterium]|nr:glycosyltransferase family protein [Synergistaceae bacterium]
MILAVLQARVSSSRLPSKVLLPLLGKPMILRQIERIYRSKMIDDFVLATSRDGSDDVLVDICKKENIPVCRGSLDDVLDRFYSVVKQGEASHIVRLTGDCPLCDPLVVDELIKFHLSGNFDYSSNIDPPTFPDGLDVEVFRRWCLDVAWSEAVLPSEREHVTLFIRNNKNRFFCGSLENDVDLSHHRWTVDEEEDYIFVKSVYENLYFINPGFGMNDILSFLDENPSLCINYKIKRNEGLCRSLERDVEFKKKE